MPADNVHPYFVCHPRSDAFVYGIQKRPYLHPFAPLEVVPFAIMIVFLLAFVSIRNSSPLTAKSDDILPILVIVVFLVVFLIQAWRTYELSTKGKILDGIITHAELRERFVGKGGRMLQLTIVYRFANPWGITYFGAATIDRPDLRGIPPPPSGTLIKVAYLNDNRHAPV